MVHKSIMRSVVNKNTFVKIESLLLNLKQNRYVL